MRAISERFRDKELIYKALYKFASLAFFERKEKLSHRQQRHCEAALHFYDALRQPGLGSIRLAYDPVLAGWLTPITLN